MAGRSTEHPGAAADHEQVKQTLAQTVVPQWQLQALQFPVCLLAVAAAAQRFRNPATTTSLQAAAEAEARDLLHEAAVLLLAAALDLRVPLRQL